MIYHQSCKEKDRRCCADCHHESLSKPYHSFRLDRVVEIRNRSPIDFDHLLQHLLNLGNEDDHKEREKEWLKWEKRWLQIANDKAEKERKRETF